MPVLSLEEAMRVEDFNMSIVFNLQPQDHSDNA